jgi:hypothetical protein
MLEKVICVDNVGVIRKGAPKSVDLQKVALIYADNARGKSTLSSLDHGAEGHISVQPAVRRDAPEHTGSLSLPSSPPAVAARFPLTYDLRAAVALLYVCWKFHAGMHADTARGLDVSSWWMLQFVR